MPLPYTLPFKLGLGPGQLLTYFTVSGHYLDVENPPLIGTNTQPIVNKVSGTVTFFPRVPIGAVLYLSQFNLAQQIDRQAGMADIALALAPIQAQIVGGVLQTPDSDNSPTIQLLSNSPSVSAALLTQGYCKDGQLIYDVQFSDIMYSSVEHKINNFAFAAPPDNTPVSITAATLARLDYAGPN